MVLDTMLLLKQKKMKDHSTDNFYATIPNVPEFSKTKSVIAKKPTYIYTEEDLGEGILDVGISA
jgi:hypothetical protein